MLNVSQLKEILAKKNYKDFSTTPGVPMIIGVRTANAKVNTYDDLVYVYYAEKTVPANDLKYFYEIYSITTVPGLDYLKTPIAGTKGTAILVPGQYEGAWVLGLHRGKQEALIQQGGQVRVYRDPNKDDKLDFDAKTIDTGYFGIDLHHAGVIDTGVVGKWSAGCQVWEHVDEHVKLINDFKRLSSTYHFTRFSYTLLTEADTV